MVRISVTYFFPIFAIFSFANSEYDITGKIALVTGASRGIGFGIANELLSNGVKGITIVSVNTTTGWSAVRLLNERFGPGKVIFIPANVTKADQLENAFSTSFDHWKGLDIVFNNVGSVKETEQMSIINTNVVSILHGTLLGLKYMSKANGGNGGVIINTSGIYGIDPVFLSPANSATRNFVNTLGRTLGHPLYYTYNNCVRIITLCPGHTDTELLSRAQIVNAISDALVPGLKDIAVQILESILLQPVKSVAFAAMVILKNGPNGSVWLVEDKISEESRAVQARINTLLVCQKIVQITRSSNN